MSNTGKGFSCVFSDCGTDITTNEKEINKLLRKIVKLVDMKALGPIHIVKGADYLPGLTAVQIIETSHIALHCFSDGCYYMFNIESCKDFDENKLKRYLIKYFKPKTYNINAIYTITMG